MDRYGRDRHVEILLVEDSPSDTELTVEALSESRAVSHLNTVQDGAQALAFLRRQEGYAQAPRPDLILLDLNLPCKDGREVLAELKSDPDLKTIPVVVLTSSRADEDVLRAYQLQCNCYITKPVIFKEFLRVVRSIENFWLAVATLPEQPERRPGMRL